MMWRWYWKAWTGPTLVVGGQFGSLPLILPRFCPDQTILIIAFDPKHRFSHLLYSAIHIHSNLKRFPMTTKKLPEGGKKPPCLRFSLPAGMDQRWGVIRSWGQPHGLVWDVIFREVFCVFFLWKEQLGEWGCAHCEAKGFTQGRRQNTKADKWVLRQNGKVDEQKQDKQYVQNQDWQIQKMKSGEDHGALGKCVLQGLEEREHRSPIFQRLESVGTPLPPLCVTELDVLWVGGDECHCIISLGPLAWLELQDRLWTQPQTAPLPGGARGGIWDWKRGRSPESELKSDLLWL